MDSNAALSTPVPTSNTLSERARAVADVAAKHADSVDRDAVFPKKAFDAIRQQRLLGILVPTALGGEGASFADVADVCYVLGQACASTAMIYAMHQVKVACIVRYTGESAALATLLRRLTSAQLLLASSTTEGFAGGNVRASDAPVIVSGDRFTLERRASCISYGEAADGIVTTARRSPDAALSDQVLVAVLKSDYTLTHLQGWDTLGMRGTRSDGYLLKVSATSDHILPVPYEKIHVQSMVPSAHLFWGSVWAGIAAGALTRTQAFVRHSARHSGGQMPPGARHFTKALASHRSLRGLLASGLANYERVQDDEKALASLEYQSMITLTKVEASELAAATVMSAMRACGLSGYRNDSEASLGRSLRDVRSAPLMINNDRILSNIATASLLSALPAGLSE